MYIVHYILMTLYYCLLRDSLTNKQINILSRHCLNAKYILAT